MTTWIDPTGKSVNEGDYYVSPDGTQHPPGWGGENIPSGLSMVAEIACPGNPLFYGSPTIQRINGTPTQTWTELPLAQAQTNMLVALASQRRQVENSGITVNGQAIGSDQYARTLLNDCLTAFNNGLTGSLDYQFANGTWISVDLATAQAMFVAIGSHVQACAANQQTLYNAIKAATDIAGLQAIDITSGWPATGA